jgi:hypothetical protein
MTNKVGRSTIQRVRHIRTYNVKDCDPHERLAKRRFSISVRMLLLCLRLVSGGGGGGRAAGWARRRRGRMQEAERLGGQRLLARARRREGGGGRFYGGARRHPPRGCRTTAQFPRSPAAYVAKWPPFPAKLDHGGPMHETLAGSRQGDGKSHLPNSTSPATHHPPPKR